MISIKSIQYIILVSFIIISSIGCNNLKNEHDDNTIKDNIEETLPLSKSIIKDSLQRLNQKVDNHNISHDVKVRKNQPSTKQSSNHLVEPSEYINTFEGNDSVRFIDPGLWYMEIEPDVKSAYTFTYPVVVLKIDPAFYHFELCLYEFEEFTSSDYNNRDSTNSSTIADALFWAEMKGYIAVINAGMFSTDYRPLGYLVHKGKIINSNKIETYNHFFGIDNNGYPSIYDVGCESVPESLSYCLNLLRVKSCKNNIVWSKQPNKQWSTALIAEDNMGYFYFIHSRSAFMVNTLAHIITNRFENIIKISYLEGGPEASLAINSNNLHRIYFGSYESDYYEKDTNMKSWPIPNVIGIKKRN